MKPGRAAATLPRRRKEHLMSEWKDPVHRLCVNAIRFLSVDAVEKANAGHPGLPMGAAPMAYVLWREHLRHNPKDPDWPDRDRFVLSAGHGSAMLYSLLHLTGYDLALDDLKSFRQWGSSTPGHPESFLVPGVECTTGPLGQGIGNAAGMALAERALASRFNRPGREIVDHYTYALCSDGDIMEGVTHEAASLAGHLRLGKLILLYDSNDVTLDGPASMSFTEDVAKRFDAYGWQVLRVEDGNTDLASIDARIREAKAEASRPTLIIVRTTLGYGAPNKGGKSKAHGSPLGEEETALARKALGWEYEPFSVPEEALAQFRRAVEEGKRVQEDWQGRFDNYAQEFPPLAAEWKQCVANELPEGWDEGLPTWKPGEKLATRVASGEALNAIAKKVPWLIGGDADISASTKTTIEDTGNFEGENGTGRNIRFGVREHAMAAMTNGIACHGGLRPFAATFFVFADYMRPSVRLAAMSGLPVIYVWTHDSIGVGEDGPTHQPVEQLSSLRAMPGITMIRPCDAAETAEAWRFAMTHTDGPVALVLTRQKLPVLDRSSMGAASGLHRGAYVLRDPEKKKPGAILIATGSEVHVALAAQELLAKDGIPARVVSMPSFEVFERQDEDYRKSVLPPRVKARVSIEAGVSFGWERWTGVRGRAIALDRFGASAPGPTNMEKFGFTRENVARAVKDLVHG